MSSTILGIAHFVFHEGQVEEFKRLSRICWDIVEQKDTGTLRYETYFNEDETRAMVVEEYESEQALIDHGEHIGDEMMEAVLSTADVHGEILGELSQEFRDMLRGGPVTAFSLATDVKPE